MFRYPGTFFLGDCRTVLTVQVGGGGAPVSPVPGSQQWKVTTGGRGWPGPGLCCDQLWMMGHVINDNQSQLRPHHRILIVQLESSRVLFPVSFWSLYKFLYHINVQSFIFIINLKVKMKFNLPERSEGQIIDDIHYWQYRVCTHRAQRALPFKVGLSDLFQDYWSESREPIIIYVTNPVIIDK